MALTFNVETGVMIPNANSYASVEDADTYIEANVHAWTSWSALDEETKQALLIWSTRYLDQRVDWNGRRQSQTSALRWPRIGVRDLDRNYIPEFTIPQELIWATCELAWNLLTTDVTAPTASAGLEKLKADVIELTFTKHYTAAELPNSVRALLGNLGTFRGSSTGFGKIKRS
jgi:hypothetical protein